MPYYDTGTFRLDQWNSLIRDVNAILANPPGDCEAIAPLPEVTAPHIWVKADVEAVRDKLSATCPDITFSAELKLWRAEILDEIEAAMAQAWCNCGDEDTEATFGPVRFTWTEIEAAYDPVKCCGYEEVLGEAYACPGMPALTHRYDSAFFPCPNNAGAYIAMATSYPVALAKTQAYRQTVNRLLYLAQHIRSTQAQVDTDAMAVDAAIEAYLVCSGSTCATLQTTICSRGSQARVHQNVLDAYMAEFLTRYPNMATEKGAADAAAATNWGSALSLQARFPTGVNMLTYGASFYTYPWAQWLDPELDTSITPLIPSGDISWHRYRTSPTPMDIEFTYTVYISPGGIPFLDANWSRNFVIDLVRPYLWRPSKWVCDKVYGNCLDGTQRCEWGPWRDENAYRPWYQNCNDDGSLGFLWCPISDYSSVVGTLEPYGVEGRVRYPQGRKNHDYTAQQTAYWNETRNWYTDHPQYDDRHSAYC